MRREGRSAAPWSAGLRSLRPSGGLRGAPAAAALWARPGAGHRSPPDLARVLGADADCAELDLPATQAAADAVLPPRIRERDVPVQQRAGLFPIDREVTRDGAAVVALPLAGETRLARGVGGRRARRGQRRAAAGESKKGSDPQSGKACPEERGSARGRSGGRAEAARKSAASRLTLCGPGSCAKSSSGTSASRSASPAKASRASDSVGRAISTRAPCARASSTAACHNVVLPIPGSPTIASAWGRSDRRKVSTAPSSDSRPTRLDTIRGYVPCPAE